MMTVAAPCRCFPVFSLGFAVFSFGSVLGQFCNEFSSTGNLVRMSGFYRLRWLSSPFVLVLAANLAGLQRGHAQQLPPDSARQIQRVQLLPAVRVEAGLPSRFAVGSRTLTLDSVA